MYPTRCRGLLQTARPPPASYCRAHSFEGGKLQGESTVRDFDTLYTEHVGRVYAVCLRMCADRQEAERLTQDVFVRAWQRLHTFRGDSELSTWLHRITVNVVLEDSRSTRRRTNRVQNVEDPGFFERGTTTPDADSRMDLERAIARLPPGARQALVLHDIEGYKHEEIARLLGTAVGTIKAQLHRARRLLRDQLGDRYAS